MLYTWIIHFDVKNLILRSFSSLVRFQVSLRLLLLMQRCTGVTGQVFVRYYNINHGGICLGPYTGGGVLWNLP